MPGREPKNKHGRDDSPGERVDTTRASASSPPPPQRRSGREGLSTSVDKDSENQETRGPKIKSTLIRDLLLSLLFFGVSFGCGYGPEAQFSPLVTTCNFRRRASCIHLRGLTLRRQRCFPQALSRRFGSLTLVSLVTRVRPAQLPAASC